MPRSVKESDPYLNSLLKYIPTEIVGAYLVIQGFILAARPDEKLQSLAILITSVALFVITPFYLWRLQGVTAVGQIIISTISFAIWVYTLGGPFETWKIYYPLIGSILLVIWTLIIPIVLKQKPADQSVV
jgi:hypothetical protein